MKELKQLLQKRKEELVEEKENELKSVGTYVFDLVEVVKTDKVYEGKIEMIDEILTLIEE